MKRVASLALVAALASCGGGGNTVPAGGASGSGGVSGPASQVRTAVTFTLKAPASSSATAVRRSQYISPSTQSLVVTLTSQNGTAITSPQAYAANVTPSACPSVSGTETCTLAVPASVGADVFTVATYDAAQASATPATLTGHLLSTASVTKTVVAGTANSVVLTLDGVVASVSLALSNAAPPTGTAATIGLTVTAEDADGNIIVGPGTYATPITLADSDTTGATGLSTTSVTGPSTAVTVAYNGNTVNATFTATAPSVSTATTTLASGISRIWVAEASSVNAFTPNGTPTTPTITAGIDNPQCIATDSSGNVYVANLGSETVTKYSPSGALLLTINVAGEPYAVAVDAAGKIYVVLELPDEIETYTPAGIATTPTILASGSAYDGLAVDASGNIYASQFNGNSQVYNTAPPYPFTGVDVFSATGAFARQIGVTGGAAGVAVDGSGKTYVALYLTNEVSTFTAAGVPTTPTITTPLSSPYGIAVDPAGNIYVANNGNNTVTIYTASGALTTTIPNVNSPTGIAVF